MVQGGDPLQCAWTKNENCKIKKKKTFKSSKNSLPFL